MLKTPTTLQILMGVASMTLSTTAGCSTGSVRPSGDPSDPYLWLEGIEDPQALEWVKQRNEKSQAALTSDPRYAQIHQEIREILVAKDRIPFPALRGGWVYNFWQDTDHVKGIWRRTRLEEYSKTEPAWETILDVDALAKVENESWVWKGTECLPPEYKKCLIMLSRGGKDAVVVREFDVENRAFVADGFNLPEAKTHVSWMDDKTIWVGTDFGPGSLTHSGYPRIAKLWKRDTPLSEAKQVFEGKVEDVSAEGFTLFDAALPSAHFVTRAPSFFESETSVYLPESGKVVKIPFPHDADFKGAFQGHALAVLRTEWEATPGKMLPQGALVSIALSDVESAAAVAAPSTAQPKVEVVYAPDDKSTLLGLSVTRDAIYLDVLSNVQGRILKVQRKGGKWKSARRPYPDNGVAHVVAADSFGHELFVSYESFLVPTTLYLDSGKGAAPKPVKSLPAKFDSKPYEVKQHWAVSKDGTKVPYFLISKKGIALDRSHPTLLYGYGGFEVSETPFYMGAIGKAWLDRGGAYALANIRGGGEFGPRWHQAALLENRQRAYDDFIAIAADLNRIRVTRPEKLGIMGGSNGGLLMGVMLTQRPDLFGAVVCQVPLLDMLRYTKLLAGASWAGEYGDPENPEMRKVIAKYSPYQNVKKELKYPRAFVLTSTKDDRVHPGHARKFVARLEEYGKDVIYFENMEGGHSAAADLEQRAKRSAMEYTYLWQQLQP